MRSKLFVVFLIVLFIFLQGCPRSANDPMGVDNTPPVAKASASPTIGKIPFTTQLSSTGSTDPEDGPNDLRFEWSVGDTIFSTEKKPSLLINSFGLINITLTVYDSKGAADAITVPVEGDTLEPTLPVLHVSEDTVFLNTSNSFRSSFNILNFGRADLAWQVNTSNSAITTTPASGANNAAISVRVDTATFEVGDTHAMLYITSNDRNVNVPVVVSVPEQQKPVTTHVTISPEYRELDRGDSLKFTLMQHFSGKRSEDATTRATFESSDTTVFRIRGTMGVALKPGTVTIAGRLFVEGESEFVSFPATVIVREIPPRVIELTVDADSVLAGSNVTFRYTVTGNAEEIQVLPGNLGVGALTDTAGTFTVRIDQPTVVTLVAKNSAGQDSDALLIKTFSPQTICVTDTLYLTNNGMFVYKEDRASFEFVHDGEEGWHAIETLDSFSANQDGELLGVEVYENGTKVASFVLPDNNINRTREFTQWEPVGNMYLVPGNRYTVHLYAAGTGSRGTYGWRGTICKQI